VRPDAARKHKHVWVIIACPSERNWELGLARQASLVEHTMPNNFLSAAMSTDTLLISLCNKLRHTRQAAEVTQGWTQSIQNQASK